MAPTSISLLLLRNLFPKNPNLRHKITLIRTCLPNGGTIKLFSTSQPSLPNHPDPKTSLSARMSFVFDQMEAVQKERTNKDDALQRIRSWRESKKEKNEEESEKLGFKEESKDLSLGSNVDKDLENLDVKEVEVVHPWPEWIEFMERLVQQNYFDHRRNDEERMIKDLAIDTSGFEVEKEDFSRDWFRVRTACLNFGRDRFDILRSLSRQDIQILVGHGCPNLDKRVVSSAKLLRKYVHVDEGDVCSSCSLRSSCSTGYLLSRKEDEARTIDVMRILLSFGFNPFNGAVQNKSLLKIKSVRTVVRKLLHGVVKLSAVPIDPNLSPPVIKRPPPKVKQPPPPPKRRVGRDDIEMKKGDWLCPKCNFMNFAKNSLCLQCDAKRPKRELLPGEWECPECNFLNYRRNMLCYHCEHKRPPGEFMDDKAQARPHDGPRKGLERAADIPRVSNAWNFDFDDNESDGADIAAFEFADAPRVAEGSSLESHAQGGRIWEDNSLESSRVPKTSERRSVNGFNDFDDDEDDDVDSYELDTATNKSMLEVSSKSFSDIEEDSGSEGFDGSDHNLHSRSSTYSISHNKPFQKMGENSKLSESEGDEEDVYSDEEHSVYPNWKSDNVASMKNRASYDGDLHLGFGSNSNGKNKQSSNRGHFRRESSDSDSIPGYGSESEDDDFHKNTIRVNKGGPDVRGSPFKDSCKFGSDRNERFTQNGRISARRNSFNDDFQPDDGDFRSGRNRKHKSGPDRKGYGQFGSNRDEQFKARGRITDRRSSFKDNLQSGNNDFQPSRNGGNKAGRDMRGSSRTQLRSTGNAKFRSRGNDDFDSRSFQGSRRNDRETRGYGYGKGRENEWKSNLRPGREEGFGNNRRNGRSSTFGNRPEIGRDSGDNRPRRRIIER